MTNKLLLTAVTLGLLTTACGDKENYRALGINHKVATDTQVVAEESNPAAEPTIEEKALLILEQDSNFKQFRSTELSNILQQETRGVSVKIIDDVNDSGRSTGKKIAKLDLSLFKNKHCSDGYKLSDAVTASDLVNTFVKIKTTARLRCLDSACASALLILESRRLVDMGDSQVGETQQAALPILLKADASGMLQPVNATSESFIKIASAVIAKDSCPIIAADVANAERREREAAQARAREEAAERAETTTTAGTGGQVTVTSNANADAAEAERLRIAEQTRLAVERGQVPAATLNPGTTNTVTVSAGTGGQTTVNAGQIVVNSNATAAEAERLRRIQEASNTIAEIKSGSTVMNNTVVQPQTQGTISVRGVVPAKYQLHSTGR